MNLSRANLRLKRRSKLKSQRRRTWLLSRYVHSLFVSFSRIPFLHLKIVVLGLFLFAISWPTTHPNFQFFIVLDTLSEKDTVFRPMAYGSTGTSFPWCRGPSTSFPRKEVSLCSPMVFISFSQSGGFFSWRACLPWI